MELGPQKRLVRPLQHSSWPVARAIGALFMICVLSATSGCGSVGKTIGMGMMATGGIASATTGFLAVGCTTPNPNDPQLEERGPCMPPETYEEGKVAIWTTFVLGIILLAAGVATYATADELAGKADPGSKKPSPKDPLEEESCKDSKYCY